LRAFLIILRRIIAGIFDRLAHRPARAQGARLLEATNASVPVHEEKEQQSDKRDSIFSTPAHKAAEPGVPVEAAAGSVSPEAAREHAPVPDHAERNLDVVEPASPDGADAREAGATSTVQQTGDTERELPATTISAVASEAIAAGIESAASKVVPLVPEGAEEDKNRMIPVPDGAADAPEARSKEATREPREDIESRPDASLTDAADQQEGAQGDSVLGTEESPEDSDVGKDEAQSIEGVSDEAEGSRAYRARRARQTSKARGERVTEEPSRWTEGRPKPARPPAEHYTAPFAGSDIASADAEYQRWNKAILEYCLLGANTGSSDTFLTVTPRILSGARSQMTGIILAPEDAEATFAEAVQKIYHSRVLRHAGRLATLRRCGDDGLPECVAFLALSVLAAYRMQTDEDAGASAYYVRLAELLNCELSGAFPAGFETDEFEGLWLFLRAWLEREHGRHLAMPREDVGLRRYVALPLTHVPLRRVDIERLPDFFDWACYEPGVRIGRAALDADLTRWSRGREVFTNAGMAALADERRAAVLAQVGHELESWDGLRTDSLGRRSGRVEILLDVVLRRPRFSYLPRRPASFPSTFDDGSRLFEASDDGWYDPIAIPPEDGPSLRAGFSWEMPSGDARLALRRPAATVIAMPASGEYTGFLSHGGLRLGAAGAALCVNELADEASRYLTDVAHQSCLPFRHPSVPEGWQLFTGFRVQRRVSAPASLEALAIEETVNLVPSGGLRLGGRWAWLAGAPPQLGVTGIERGQPVMIDGEQVAVSEDGTLDIDGRLSRPGVYIVETSGLRRRIEIVEPALTATASLASSAARATNVVALPPGSWCLLGAVPGEVATPAFQTEHGAVAACPFKAVWAIEIHSGHAARVLCLSLAHAGYNHSQRLPVRGTAARLLSSWISTIYDAATRRVPVERLDGAANGQEVARAWSEYAQAARDIKRRIRKARS